MNKTGYNMVIKYKFWNSQLVWNALHLQNSVLIQSNLLKYRHHSGFSKCPLKREFLASLGCRGRSIQKCVKLCYFEIKSNKNFHTLFRKDTSTLCHLPSATPPLIFDVTAIVWEKIENLNCTCPLITSTAMKSCLPS